MSRSRSVRRTGAVLIATAFPAVLPATAAAERAVAVSAFAPQRVVSFDTASPGTLDSEVPVRGLQRKELVEGIDHRPATGEIYARTSAGRVLTLEPSSGQLSPVGTVTSRSFVGTDFNPVVDRLRTVSVSDANERTTVNPPVTTTVDTPLQYAAGDPNAGRNPTVSAAAYTNNVAEATETTLYDIDSGLNVLATQAPPNDGTLNTVGPIGVNTTDETGFDISGRTGDAFAILTPSSPRRSNLYRVNLTTGATTVVAGVGPRGRYRGLTLAPVELGLLGSTPAGGNGTAEIADFDPATRRLFVTDAANRQVDVFDASAPSAPTAISSIPVGGVPNSLDIHDGIVAVAVEAAVRQDPGVVRFFETGGENADRGQAAVGAIPDMVTFTPDGTKLLVANEGEPTGYGREGDRDPEGSVSIVTPPSQPDTPVRTAGFTAFNGGVPNTHPGGPGATFAQNAEPEYIAVDPDSDTAYVTLQETNAVATLDVSAAEITAVKGLGRKSHGPGAGLDPSDQAPRSINLFEDPRVVGLYQPDAIAAFTAGGETRLVTANEGDARDYAGFSEERRVGNSAYTLDPVAFPDAASVKSNNAFGRLTATTVEGDTEGDGDFDRIVPFGARSLSVLDDEGTLTDDTGDELERETAARQPSSFNSDGTAAAFDTRSDNKGPEPEGVVVGAVGSRTIAFLGNERQGSIFAYDVGSDPGEATLAGYSPSRESLVAPEGLAFVRASDSPTGRPLVIAAYEVTGSAGIYEVRGGR